MSAINPEINNTSVYNRPAATGKSTQNAVTDSVTAKDEDTLTLSPEAKKAAEAEAAKETQKTKNREELRALMEKLSASRTDIDSHIRTVLKKSGIDLAKSEKIKVEVNGKGKIVVGGINDKEKAKAIEEALNKEQGLAKKITDFQRETKVLSRQLKEETGSNLAELIDQARGKKDDWSKGNYMMTNMTVEDDAFFSDLQDIDFFASDPDMLGFMKDLAADTGIELMTGNRVLTEPEQVIKDNMMGAQRSIIDAFKDYNDGVRELMKNDPDFGTPEFNEKYLLSLDRVKVQLDSNGGVHIEGELAKDGRTKRQGEEIIEQIMKGMFNDVSNDPEMAGTNELRMAMDRVLDLYNDEYGAEAASDAVVMASLGSGAESGKVRLSSETKEEEIRLEAQEHVNALLKEMDIDLVEPVEIELDEKGKIRAVNLREDDPNRKIIEGAIETLNVSLETAAEDDKKLGRLKRLLNHHLMFQDGGTTQLQKNEFADSEKTITDYAVNKISHESLEAEPGTSTLDLQRIQSEIDSLMPHVAKPGESKSDQEYKQSFADYDNSQAFADYLAGNATLPTKDGAGDFSQVDTAAALDAWLRGEGVFRLEMFGGTDSNGFRVSATGKSLDLLNQAQAALRNNQPDTLAAIQREVAKLTPADVNFQDITGLGELGLEDRQEYLDLAGSLLAKAGLDRNPAELRYIFNDEGEVSYGANASDMQRAIEHALNRGVDSEDKTAVQRLQELGKKAFTDKLMMVNARDTFLNVFAQDVTQVYHR